MRPNKQQALAATYAAMSSAEIRRRLLGGALTEVAAGAAQAELDRRDAAGSHAPSAPAADHRQGAGTAAGLILQCGLIATAGWLFLSAEINALVVGVIVVPSILMVIGKALPRFGLLLGLLLMSTPLWLGVLMASTGALSAKGADFKPLGAFLAWMVLITASILGIAWGGALLGGARHKGSWAAWVEAIRAQQKKAADAITRRR